MHAKRCSLSRHQVDDIAMALRRVKINGRRTVRDHSMILIYLLFIFLLSDIAVEIFLMCALKIRNIGWNSDTKRWH